MPQFGFRKVQRKPPDSRFLIEGELVTIREAAQRLGLNPNTAASRYSRLKSLPGAITWDRLAEGK